MIPAHQISKNIVPTIGSKGYYDLKEPLHTLIQPTEIYTCKAIRHISDYISNNEDIKKDIYDEYRISNDSYNKDVSDDTIIVSLQSEQGHWLYVPSSYIKNYPISNGVEYKSVVVAVSLPYTPVKKDLSQFILDLKSFVKNKLGLLTDIKLLDTSKVFSVNKKTHESLENDRKLLTTESTDLIRIGEQKKLTTDLKNKLAGLETFILNNYEKLLFKFTTSTYVDQNLRTVNLPNIKIKFAALEILYKDALETIKTYKKIVSHPSTTSTAADSYVVIDKTNLNNSQLITKLTELETLYTSALSDIKDFKKVIPAEDNFVPLTNVYISLTEPEINALTNTDLNNKFIELQIKYLTLYNKLKEVSNNGKDNLAELNYLKSFMLSNYNRFTDSYELVSYVDQDLTSINLEDLKIKFTELEALYKITYTKTI